MRQAIRHPVLNEILGTRAAELSTETGKTFYVKNTNKLLWSDDELLGGKTGFTNAAQHCFVCAGERDKSMLIVALLGVPSRIELWKETEDLMSFGAKVMQNQEEPVVYLTRADYDATKLTGAAYTRKVMTKPKAAKGRRSAVAKAAPSGRGKVVNATHTVKAKSDAKAKAGVKAKGKTKSGKNTKMMVKAKKTKKTNMATNGQDRISG
jgi:D-alanyl-D-alanine carboxypeptidase (penicillin-binding protein 5/6)